MNLLTIQNATKIYTERAVLSQTDFGFEEGEKVGVIGRNGEGKSTFLRILAGEEELDSGKLTKNNQIKLSYLPQNPKLPENKTLGEYVGTGGEEKALLNRFGFSDLEIPVSLLSGGQKKKAALAKALLTPCEVLLLDEPTNHLDQDMILWLENYLIQKKQGLIMVTHDRYFLDRICSRIVELDQGKLYSYETNYEGFLEEKAARKERELGSYRKSRSILKKELEWVKRGARARSTKQKARLMRYEELKERKAPQTQEEMEISSLSSRLGKKTLELSHVEKSFESKKIISDFSYLFLKGDRIGIIGKNGCGKTTLMNMIAGEIKPDSGLREEGPTVKIGYFSQENEKLDEKKRVIDYIRDTAEYIKTEDGMISASAMLERFLFDSAMQYSPIEKLSGGEKRRLYLLKILMEAPNILLLDEPTNDLDIPSLAVLEDYLDDFPGIVVSVSHDRYFLDRTVSRIFAFQKEGRIRKYEGNFSDYLEKKEMEGPSLEPVGQKEPGAGKKRSPRHEEKLRFTFQEKKEYETIEEDIEALENTLSSLEKQMDVSATDYAALSELTARIEETKKTLEEKMERYVYLEDLAQKIKAQEEK